MRNKKILIVVMVAVVAALIGFSLSSFAKLNKKDLVARIADEADLSINRDSDLNIGPLISAMSRLEGMVHAYAAAHGASAQDLMTLEDRLFIASDDLSVELDEFNDILRVQSYLLSDEQQDAVVDAYIPFGEYIDQLASDANDALDEDVFVVIQLDGPDTRIPLRSFGTAGST